MAMPASGKTYGSIQYIKSRIEDGEKFIISAISVDLCKQILEDIPDNIKTNLLISETVSRSQLVSDNFLEAVKDKTDDIIIITHRTLMVCYDKLNGEGWNIIVDELPNIHSTMFMKIPSLEDDTYARWLTYLDSEPDNSTGFRRMGLRVGFEDKLKTYLDNFEEVREEESFINKGGLQGLKGVLNGQTVLLRKQTETLEGNISVEYAFNSIYEPEILFKGFKEVIFLCAEFDRQLTGLLFKHKFGIEVKEKTEITLRQDKYERPERIKIYPLVKAPKVFSRRLSESWYCKDTRRKYDKHVNKKESYIEFFELLVNTASDIVGDEGYIYTVNKFRNEMVLRGDYSFLQESDKVKMLKYNPHGLNNYMDYNISLGLFCCNPNSIQKMLLRELDSECNVEEGTFEKGYETTAMNDPIFQLVTRSKIRKFDVLEEIICIVPDHRCADYLINTWFKGAVVDWKYAVEVVEGKTGAPKSFRGEFNMNQAEYKKWQRYVNKQLGMKVKDLKVNDKHDYELVKEWIENERKL